MQFCIVLSSTVIRKLVKGFRTPSTVKRSPSLEREAKKCDQRTKSVADGMESTKGGMESRRCRVWNPTESAWRWRLAFSSLTPKVEALSRCEGIGALHIFLKPADDGFIVAIRSEARFG